MSNTIKNAESFALILDERQAVAAEIPDVAIDGFDDEEINRYWPEAAQAGETDISDIKEFLRFYTSSKNFEADKNKRMRYVDDPMVNRRIRRGRYRQARTTVQYKSNGDIANVTQTLRKGFETSVQASGGDAVDWSKARLLNSNQAYGMEAFYTIIFPHISIDHVKAVCDYLDGLPVSGFNPVINGESIGSGLHRLSTVHRQQDDASCVVTLFLADPEVSYSGYRNYNTWRQQNITYHDNVPKELQNGIIEAWKAVGRSAESSYNPTTKLYRIQLSEKGDITDNLTEQITSRSCSGYCKTSYYWGVTEAELLAVVALIPGVDDEITRGVTYTINSISNNGDGTYNVVLTVCTAITRTYADRRLETALGRDTTRGEILDSVSDEDIVDITVAEQGVQKVQRIRIKDNCAKDIITDITTRRSIAHTSKTVNNTGLVTVTEEVTTGLKSDSDITDVSGATAAGEAKSNRISYDPVDGSINESVVTEQEQPATVNDDRLTEDSNGHKINETSKLNQTSVPSIGTPGIGERLVMSVSMTANKAFNYVKRKLTSKPQATGDIVATERSDYKTTLNRKQNQASAPDSLVAASGKIQELRGLVKNDDGTYSYEEVETTPKSQTASQYDYSQLRNSEVSITTNSDSDASAPTGVEDGITKQVRAQANAFGKYDKTEVTVETTKRLWSRKSFNTRYGTGYISIGKYCSEDDFDTELALYSDGTQNSISVAHNDNGTVNFVIIGSPYNSSGDEDNYGSANFDLTTFVPISNGKAGSYRTYVDSIEITYRSTKQQAYNDIDGGVKGSYVRKVGGTLWEAYKIAQRVVYNKDGTTYVTIPSSE